MWRTCLLPGDGPATLPPHRVELKADAKPIPAPYATKLTRDQMDWYRKKLDMMVGQNIVRRSNAHEVMPVVIPEKPDVVTINPDGSETRTRNWRLTVNCKSRNETTIDSFFPMPVIADLL